MARRSRKLPFASAGGEPELTISEVDWQRIEGEYGNKLPPDVRKAVFEATQTFLYFEVFERTAERVADAEAIIDACKRGASEFQRTLLAHAFQSSDAGVYATHLIKKSFHDTRLANKDRLFDTLGGLLTSFHVACNLALKELSDPATPSHKEGEAWGLWTRRLTKIMKENGLPTGIRKDAGNKSKSDKQSRFALFVWELQNRLPVECRRSTQSEAALADAISDARKIGAEKPRATAE